MASNGYNFCPPSKIPKLDLAAVCKLAENLPDGSEGGVTSPNLNLELGIDPGCINPLEGVAERAAEIA